MLSVLRLCPVHESGRGFLLRRARGEERLKIGAGPIGARANTARLGELAFIASSIKKLARTTQQCGHFFSEQDVCVGKGYFRLRCLILRHTSSPSEGYEVCVN